MRKRGSPNDIELSMELDHAPDFLMILTKLIQGEEDIAVGKATAQKTTIVCEGTDKKTGKPCGRKATLVWKDGTALCRQCFNEMAKEKFPTNKSGVIE